MLHSLASLPDHVKSALNKTDMYENAYQHLRKVLCSFFYAPRLINENVCKKLSFFYN